MSTIALRLESRIPAPASKRLWVRLHFSQSIMFTTFKSRFPKLSADLILANLNAVLWSRYQSWSFQPDHHQSRSRWHLLGMAEKEPSDEYQQHAVDKTASDSCKRLQNLRSQETPTESGILWRRTAANLNYAMSVMVWSKPWAKAELWRRRSKASTPSPSRAMESGS